MSASREKLGSPAQVQSRSAPGCGFVLWWVILNFVGAILGLLLGGIVAFILSLVSRVILPVTFTSAILLVTIGIALVTSGAVIGSAQWLVLRGQIAITVKWIGATALGWTGWGIVMLLGFFLPGFASRGGGGVQALLVGLTVASAGAILGAAQWFVLRKRVNRAGAWVLINIAAWVLTSLAALASIFAGGELLGLNGPLDPRMFEIPVAVMDLITRLLLFSLSAMFLLVPAITGIGLAWLLRSSPQPQNR